jgi:hypothetical protein
MTDYLDRITTNLLLSLEVRSAGENGLDVKFSNF